MLTNTKFGTGSGEEKRILNPAGDYTRLLNPYTSLTDSNAG
jgi:hypothetical protein